MAGNKNVVVTKTNTNQLMFSLKEKKLNLSPFIFYRQELPDPLLGWSLNVDSGKNIVETIKTYVGIPLGPSL